MTAALLKRKPVEKEAPIPQPTDQLKAAVIGTGAISKEHLTFLQKSERATLVGVCDLSPAAGRYAAETFEVAAAYTDYCQMLSETQPDVVHILTPPHTHQRLATDCLEAGAHVVCEKPVALSYPEFEQLWAVAQRCDRTLIEDHNYRFNEPVLAIQQLVAAGAIGTVQEVEVRMALDIRSGGRYADENLPSPIHQLPAGVVHDFITHLSYLLLTFLPCDYFDRVSAAWSNHGGGDLFKFDDLDATVICDRVHGRLRFSSYTQPDCFSITVRGDRGTAEVDLFQPFLRYNGPHSLGKQLSPLVNHWQNGWGLVNASLRNFRNKVMQHTPYEGLHTLLDRTYQALAAGEQPPVTYADMARTSQLIDALLNQENWL
ncbi:MAG: Gfo/Idh/MocA family oxidoreductase [Cyanobacteria bacterium J06554_6]